MVHLPKFWKDKGGWNDSIVTLAITASVAGGLLLSFRCNSIMLAIGTLILAPIIGLLLGFCVVFVLCTYFGKD